MFEYNTRVSMFIGGADTILCTKMRNIKRVDNLHREEKDKIFDDLFL